MPSAGLVSVAAYTAQLDKLIAKAQRLDKGTLRSIYGFLNDARKEISDAITSARDFNLVHLEALKGRVERTMGELTRVLGNDLGGKQRGRWDDGAQDSDNLLARFGGDAERLAQSLDLTQLTVIQDLSAELVTNMSVEAVNDIEAELRFAMMGEQSAHKAMERIGKSLVDKHGNPAPGVFGDVLTRSEAIYRTETNRAYSAAADARMTQHNQARPGLKKVWRHSGGLNPRASHQDAERRYSPGGDPGPVPVDQPFVIHVGVGESNKGVPFGKYKAMFPRDPALPPGLSVNCRCNHGPWRDRWADLDLS